MRATWLCAALIGGVVAIPTRGTDDPPPITKKDRVISTNNLKQIGLAFHNYHDANDTFPGNITSKDGKALLSWRVAILPYIEQQQLYNQFKLDEPWDSKHNIELVASMPKLYAPIRIKVKAGETFYQTFTGEKALFDPKAKLPTLAWIASNNGTSYTGMVFEAGESVVWSKPADMPFDVEKPLPKLGGLFDGECNVVCCDGSVRCLKKGADEKELKKFISPTNTEAIDFKKIAKP